MKKNNSVAPLTTPGAKLQHACQTLSDFVPLCLFSYHSLKEVTADVEVHKCGSFLEALTQGKCVCPGKAELDGSDIKAGHIINVRTNGSTIGVIVTQMPVPKDFLEKAYQRVSEEQSRENFYSLRLAEKHLTANKPKRPVEAVAGFTCSKGRLGISRRLFTSGKI